MTSGAVARPRRQSKRPRSFSDEEDDEEEDEEEEDVVAAPRKRTRRPDPNPPAAAAARARPPAPPARHEEADGSDVQPVEDVRQLREGDMVATHTDTGDFFIGKCAFVTLTSYDEESRVAAGTLGIIWYDTTTREPLVYRECRTPGEQTPWREQQHLAVYILHFSSLTPRGHLPPAVARVLYERQR